MIFLTSNQFVWQEIKSNETQKLRMLDKKHEMLERLNLRTRISESEAARTGLGKITSRTCLKLQRRARAGENQENICDGAETKTETKGGGQCRC